MIIQPLTVGPIVGYTSGEHVRIWGRGEVDINLGKPRRCIGVARIRAAGSNSWRKPRFAEMSPNFDMTAILVFDDLLPDKGYEYQFGYFFSEIDVRSLGGDLDLDWSQIERISLRTGIDDPKAGRSFVFGSCRYLLRIFGVWFDDRGDKTFRSVIDQINAGRKTDMLIMLGDQIYADDLLYIERVESPPEYMQRYRDAFAQPHIRALMSRIPTYMTFDDHEIENDWPQSATPRDWVVKYPAAMHALLTYQLSHSPLYELDENRRIQGVPNKLWYSFSDGCCDFFFTDTRTERYLSHDDEEREIINDRQMDALTNWLADGSGRVKVIASATMFLPDDRGGSPDAWGGYLKQRTQLFDFIRKHKIQRVVTLSGDVHCSMTAELIHETDPEFKVISLVSSPFFWPYPHSKSSAFALQGSLRTLPPAGGYIVQNGGPVHSTDNFTRVTVNLEGVTAEIFSRKGELLGVKSHKF